MSEYGERPAWSMTGGELLSELDALNAELAQLQIRRLRLIARLDEIGHATELGAGDLARLLVTRYRLDRGEAYRDVRLARALPKYQTVSTALDDTASGESSRVFRPAQAEAIITVLEKLPTTVPVEDIETAEQALVGAATRGMSPADLRKTAEQARNLLDTDGPEPAERRAHRRESLVLGRADNGVKFRGFLANDNAELFRSLIHTGARPQKTLDGELDPRPREKRQADALSAVLTIAAAATDTGPTTPPTTTTTAEPTTSSAPATTAPAATPRTAPVPASAATSTAAPPGTAPTGAGRGTTTSSDPGAAPCPRNPSRVPGFGAKANITVTIDYQDLKSAAADATGEVVYGDDLSAATVRRLACDAKIIPLVLGSNSEPLDVGRVERLVTRGMRRALNARDKGCVVCAAPPIHCDAHHLEHWISGGATAVHNLVLLCRRHHIDLHAGHWKITITNGKVHVTRPTWADPPPRPRRTTTHPLPAPTPAPIPARRPALAPVPTAGIDPWDGDDPNAPSPAASLDTRADAPVTQRLNAGPPDESGGGACAQPARRDGETGPQEAARLGIWGTSPAAGRDTHSVPHTHRSTGGHTGDEDARSMDQHSLSRAGCVTG